MDFIEFERDWLRRHRGSIVSKPRISSWGLIFGIGLWSVISVGAAIVSAAHSVPAIQDTIPPMVSESLRGYLSLFGFTIFELMIFAGALYQRESKFSLIGLILAMIGALAANIGSSIHAVDIRGGDDLAMAVALVLAFTAPLAAFLAGEMVYHLYAKHETKITEANAIYDTKRKELDATINREYTRYQKEQEKKAHQEQLVKEERERQNREVEQRNFVNLRQVDTPDRPSPKLKRALEWLREHPEELETESRELARLIGVSHTLANDARKVVKYEQNGHSNNGHSEVE